MDEREKKEFRTIAMGALGDDPQFAFLAAMTADHAAGMFTLLKRYGIESEEDITFVCENGIPCITVSMHPHLRDHFRHAGDHD